MVGSLRWLLVLDICWMVSGECVLDLQEDFPSASVPQPVFTRRVQPDPAEASRDPAEASHEPLTPGSDGRIHIDRHQISHVACPGSGREIMTDNCSQHLQYSELECLQGSWFRLGAWAGRARSISCNMQPYKAVQRTHETCFENNYVLSVGYRLRHASLALYAACHDPVSLATLFVRHRLRPGTARQGGGTRPEFLVQMDNNTTRRSRRLRATHRQRGLADLLGAGGAVTDALLIRSRVTEYNRTVTVYTGTFGTVSLTDKQGKLVPIYLAKDAEDKPVIPVPLYIYKVIFSPEEKTAVAFVTINLPYEDEELSKYVFCSDICEVDGSYDWVRSWKAAFKWNFCCDYQEFAFVVYTLEKLDVVNRFH